MSQSQSLNLYPHRYVPYVGDSKRAMDEYTSEIFMGGKVSDITDYPLSDYRFDCIDESASQYVIIRPLIHLYLHFFVLFY
jgi:myo-inositol-1-phosphate synthase